MSASRLALLLGSAWFLAASPLAQAQDRILYLREKNSQDVNLIMGKIIEESAARIVVQMGNAKQEIPVDTLIEVTYQLPADQAKARELYAKAETMVQSAGQATTQAKRKELLGQAIALFNMLAPEVKDSKPVSRHVQFKIASLTAQQAKSDRELAKKALDALLRFQQDHPDSWQNHFANKLITEMKKG